MKNLKKIKTDLSLKQIKKVDLKKIKGGTASTGNIDIYDL